MTFHRRDKAAGGKGAPSATSHSLASVPHVANNSSQRDGVHIEDNLGPDIPVTADELFAIESFLASEIHEILAGNLLSPHRTRSSDK